MYLTGQHHSTIRIGARFQKVGPPHKIYRVIATVKPDSQPIHVRLAAEVDSTQVITVSASVLSDGQFWHALD